MKKNEDEVWLDKWHLFAFKLSIPEAPREFFPDSNWIGAALLSRSIKRACLLLGGEVRVNIHTGDLNDSTYVLAVSDFKSGFEGIETVLAEAGLKSFAIVGVRCHERCQWKTLLPHPEFPFTVDFDAILRENEAGLAKAERLFRQ